MDQYGLVGVHISITSLKESTRRILEPRTASIKKRLQTIKTLSENKVPVNAMFAPIIPGINSHEILDMAKTASAHGAVSFAQTIVRLNGAIGQIFSEWIKMTMPDKADKVLNLIASCHGGKVNDSRFGLRVRGEGNIAKQIHDMGKLARRMYFHDKKFPALNKSIHAGHKDGQWKLFE